MPKFKFSSKIFLILFPLIFLIHGAIIAFYAVDLPFMDEWEALGPNALPAGFSWSWLFAQHNEHRIVFTKLQTWALYYLNAWDLRSQIVMNYFIFGALLWVLIKFKQRVAKELDLSLYLAFLVFLLSPLLHQNHMWGFQSQFHFTLLFFLSAAYFWFSPAQSNSALALGSLSAVCSIFSFSNGLVACSGLFGVFALYKVVGIFQAQSSQLKRKYTAQLLSVGIVVIAALLAWAHGFQKLDPTNHWVFPNSYLFWRYFLNLVSLGFGANGESTLVGLIAFGFVLYPFAMSLRNNRFRQWSVKEWMLLACTVGVLGALSTIALGRGFNRIGSKSSRYAEMAILLIPLSFLMWRSYLLASPQKLKRFYILFWLILAFSFLDDWKMVKPYRSHAASVEVGAECIRAYYHGAANHGLCVEAYPYPIGDRFDRAKAMGISFARKLAQ